ncbi:MAG: hypothetical protein ACOX2F_07960 [bacterium]
MIKKILFFSFFSFFSFPLLIYGASVDIRDVKDEAILTQLSEDPTVIPMEKGALFVPYIVDPVLEPHCTIFKGKDFVADAPTGQRIPLFEGEYSVFIGSGPLDMQTKIKVNIKNERTTVIIPTWSALIIKTIDQNNNDIRESYNLVNEKTKVQIGTGTGADILRGEKEQVWILATGLYRITKRGESPYSFQNFVTARTQKGKLSTVQLIFEEKTRAVLGGGEVISDTEDRKYTGNWSFKANISGNFSLVNSGYIKGGSGSSNDFTFGSTLNGSIIYDDQNFLFINRLEINELFQKPAGEKLKFVKDLMKFDSSFIYRINQYVGPYISFRVRAPFGYKYFKTSKDSSEPQVSVTENDGSSRQLERDQVFTYSKSFSTTILQEGVGINADYAYGNVFKITGRTGWGFRQDFAPFSYDISKLQSDNVITRVPYFKNMTGPEFYLYISWFPLSFLELKEEFDALLPIDNVSRFSFFSKTSAFVWISKFAAIQYVFEIEKSPVTSSASTITSEHTLTVQIYYNFL